MRIRYDFVFYSLVLIGPFEQKIRILLSRFTLNFTLNFTELADRYPVFQQVQPLLSDLVCGLLFFFFYHDSWTILTKTCNNVQIIVVVARAGEIFLDFTLSFYSPLSDISRLASCTPLSIISFYRSRDKFHTSIFTRKFLFLRDLPLCLFGSILHGLAGIFNAVIICIPFYRVI